MPTVAFDTVSNLGHGQSGSGVSGSLTIGSSATALLVAVGGYSPSVGYASLTTRTVTVGSTALTLLQAINCDNTAGYGWIELWGIINPPTGAQTITAVEKIGSTVAYLNVTAISFTGVSQFGTPVANYGTAATITSGGIVSSTGSRVLSIQGGYDATLSAPSGTSRSNQPASPITDYVTLLVEDQAGASTVTQTSTVAGPNGWGAVSINLVAGNPWLVSAAQSLTFALASTASFVGNVWTSGAARSMAMAMSATAIAQPLGPALRYVGRPPDTSGVICTAAYAQSDVAAFLVTPTWISQQITLAVANLVSEAWINERVANYTTQTQVEDTLSTSYLPTSTLGSSVAQLGSNGYIPSGILPTIPTNSLALNYDVQTSGVVYLPPGVTYTTTTPNLGELKIATIDIPYPGYPWLPYPFAVVEGYSSAAGSGSNLYGNGNFGILTVTPLGETTPLYGACLCTDDTVPNFYQVIPSAVSTGPVTPASQPPITTDITLELSGCNWAGSNYTFSGNGLTFFVAIFPALAGA